jgi:hypothetical protein
MKKQIANPATITETSIKDTTSITDYLEASGEASQRTRVITIVMIVACVLVFVALLNSVPNDWMQDRIKSFNGKMGKDYVISKIGQYPRQEDFTKRETDGREVLDKDAFIQAKDLYGHKYRDFTHELIRGYVDNSLSNRVPFFGFTFDVNDLGLISSMGFLVILSCFRFCITRELENLRIFFEEAEKQHKLEPYYNLLAMKQVLTVPKTKHINRSLFLILAPKIVVVLPLIIYSAVTFNDFYTGKIGMELHPERYQTLLAVEVVTLFLLAILTGMAIIRMFRLEKLWEEKTPFVDCEKKSIFRQRYYSIRDRIMLVDDAILRPEILQERAPQS